MPLTRTAVFTASGFSLMNRLSSMVTCRSSLRVCLAWRMVRIGWSWRWASRPELRPRRSRFDPQRKRYQEWRAAVGGAAGTLRLKLVTNHVLAGALIGAAARHPAPAFLLGVASHLPLDTVPHWGDFGGHRQFMRVAVPDGLAALAAIGVFAAAAPPGRRLAVLSGMAGAALPDIDKPSRIWFGRSPFPRAFDELHFAIQHEARGRAHYELVFAVVFSAATLALLKRS